MRPGRAENRGRERSGSRPRSGARGWARGPAAEAKGRRRSSLYPPGAPSWADQPRGRRARHDVKEIDAKAYAVAARKYWRKTVVNLAEKKQKADD